MAQNVPENALFVCFGGMSNVGVLTGLAGLEAARRAGPDKAQVFCLGGLPTQAPSVMEKTGAVRRIVSVDGCQMNCAQKIVENAGFRPARAITLVQDCGLQKGPPAAYNEADLETVIEAILNALETDAFG
jgi:uncharacterized metal-binding protein